MYSRIGAPARRAPPPQARRARRPESAAGPVSGPAAELLDLLRIHVGQAAAIALLAQPGPAGSPDAANPLLTPRQTRILQLVADGQSDRGIARTLGISTRTVQAHLQHTYRALDVTSRTEAVARLRALGAVSGLSRPGRLARW